MPPSKNKVSSISIGLTKNGNVMEALTALAILPSLKTTNRLESISEATHLKGIIKLSKFPSEAAYAYAK